MHVPSFTQEPVTSPFTREPADLDPSPQLSACAQDIRGIAASLLYIPATLFFISLFRSDRNWEVLTTLAGIEGILLLCAFPRIFCHLRDGVKKIPCPEWPWPFFRIKLEAFVNEKTPLLPPLPHDHERMGQPKEEAVSSFSDSDTDTAEPPNPFNQFGDTSWKDMRCPLSL